MLKDNSLEEQQGELLKGVLNLEELLNGAIKGAFSLGIRLEKLTREQQATLQEALLDAFSRSDLRSMVKRTMGARLDEIAGGNNDAETVFNLLEWAERNGKLNELVEGALRVNPGTQASRDSWLRLVAESQRVANAVLFITILSALTIAAGCSAPPAATPIQHYSTRFEGGKNQNRLKDERKLQVKMNTPE